MVSPVPYQSTYDNLKNTGCVSVESDDLRWTVIILDQPEFVVNQASLVSDLVSFHHGRSDAMDSNKEVQATDLGFMDVVPGEGSRSKEQGSPDDLERGERGVLQAEEVEQMMTEEPGQGIGFSRDKSVMGARAEQAGRQRRTRMANKSEIALGRYVSEHGSQGPA